MAVTAAEAVAKASNPRTLAQERCAARTTSLEVDAALGPLALRVLGCCLGFQKRSGEVHALQASMARMLGVDAREVKRELGRLRRLGLESYGGMQERVVPRGGQLVIAKVPVRRFHAELDASGRVVVGEGAVAWARDLLGKRARGHGGSRGGGRPCTRVWLEEGEEAMNDNGSGENSGAAPAQLGFPRTEYSDSVVLTVCDSPIGESQSSRALARVCEEQESDHYSSPTIRRCPSGTEGSPPLPSGRQVGKGVGAELMARTAEAKRLRDLGLPVPAHLTQTPSPGPLAALPARPLGPQAPDPRVTDRLVPSVSWVAQQVTPELPRSPPRLGANLSTREVGLACARAFAGAYEARFGRACWALCGPDERVERSKNFRRVCEVGERLRELGWEPSLWCVHSFDAWRHIRAGGVETAPGVAYVFSLSRLERAVEAGWFEEDRPRYAQSIARRNKPGSQLLLDLGAVWEELGPETTRAEAVAVWDEWFPGDSFERRFAEARAEKLRMDGETRRLWSEGKYMWGMERDAAVGLPAPSLEPMGPSLPPRWQRHRAGSK